MLLRLLVLILISGCGMGVETKPTPLIPIESHLPVNVIENKKDFFCLGNGTKRLFLIHGMLSDVESLLKYSPYKELTERVVNNGIELFLFNNKEFDPKDFEDGGEAYLGTFLRRLEGLIETSNNCFRHEARLFIAGVSWGGLHALVGASYLDFEGYAALIPVIELSAIPDEKYKVSHENFKPLIDILRFKPGFLGWSTSDEWVNYRLTEDFYARLFSLGAPIEYDTYDADHSIGDPVKFIDWMVRQ